MARSFLARALHLDRRFGHWISAAHADIWKAESAGVTIPAHGAAEHVAVSVPASIFRSMDLSRLDLLAVDVSAPRTQATSSWHSVLLRVLHRALRDVFCSQPDESPARGGSLPIHLRPDPGADDGHRLVGFCCKHLVHCAGEPNRADVFLRFPASSGAAITGDTSQDLSIRRPTRMRPGAPAVA